MNNFDIDYALEHIRVLIDSREHPNAAYHRRIKSIGYPVETVALSYGDYSCKTVLPDGRKVDMRDKVSIERKMNLSELCSCFGIQRARFQREFLRAKEDGARIYLLVENATWEDVFNGNYQSKYNPKALVASLLAWQIRYDMKIIFCTPSMTGKLIAELLKRELKEYLETMY